MVMNAMGYEVEIDDELCLLYIKVREGVVVETKEVSENVYIDFDKAGAVLGIEII